MVNSREPVLLVVDSTTQRILSRCIGPEPDGSCPHVGPGDVVDCAGQEILRLEGEWVDGIQVAVDCAAVVCPVAGG